MEADRGTLFHAHDLADLNAALRKWWRLHAQVRPALDFFAEHISHGNTYSPTRLLTLHTALEAYAKIRHGHKDFRRLRQYARVSNELTGCTNTALALLGASRDYYAHLRHTGQKSSADEIEEAAVPSIRRASALMQACLLRELGFTKAHAEELLQGRYRSWPIP